MIKKAILPLTFSFIFLSCGNHHKHDNNITRSIPDVTVLVYDISISTDEYAVLEAAHFNMIYHHMEFTGGGKFYGIFIKTNSQKQDLVIQDVPALDTLAIKGNSYQQQNQKNKNKELLTQFENDAIAFVKITSEKMMLPKKDKFSDVEHALELAKNTLENPQYIKYTKQLLIISDMQNDFPPKDGIDSMSPVKFGADVKIAVVRPSDKVNVTEMIGGAKYSSYTTIADAINGLFNK